MSERVWFDSGITIHRSAAHPATWSANLPGTEVATIMDSAGPLRTCQSWVIASYWRYGFDFEHDAIRWVRVDADEWRLEMRAPAAALSVEGGQQ